ncbi:protein kinase C delta type-like [Eleutherodactylus coqui]|uniref:protein kinase C delta type-like n=1 Tax=Eleutherodactylus coqui TaxID=57060 RepID=UPI0034619258
MSAGPGQSDFMEEEEQIRREKGVRRPRGILDSSDEASSKSQRRKKRKRSSSSASSAKSIVPPTYLVKKDLSGKKRPKKRHLDSSVGEKDPPEDPAVFGQLAPLASSMNIRERLRFHPVLGQGAYGSVVLAEDPATRQQYAVKSGLLAEIGLRDMHILLGLEYLSCGDLDNFLQLNGPLDITSARRILADIKLTHFLSDRLYAAEMVCGIQHLHAKGIVHRDLKPENILVAETGHLKITDFSLALDNMHGDRTATDYAGSEGYVAPEIIAEEEYNAGVDWYSLGVIINEMITGERKYHLTLFDRSTLSAAIIIIQLLQRDPAKRLGVHGNIQRHCFFQPIDWDSVNTLRMASPHIPAPSKLEFHQQFDLDTMETEEAKQFHFSPEDQAKFRGFSFSNVKTLLDTGSTTT